MRNAGYTDVERGERGSTEEHLTVTQFKVQREQERLDSLTSQIDQKEQSLAQTNAVLSKKEQELAAVQKKATLTKEALIHVRDLDYDKRDDSFLAFVLIAATCVSFSILHI